MCRLGLRWGCKRDLMVGWIIEIHITMLNNYSSSRDQSDADWTPWSCLTPSILKGKEKPGSEIGQPEQTVSVISRRLNSIEGTSGRGGKVEEGPGRELLPLELNSKTDCATVCSLVETAQKFCVWLTLFFWRVEKNIYSTVSQRSMGNSINDLFTILDFSLGGKFHFQHIYTRGIATVNKVNWKKLTVEDTFICRRSKNILTFKGKKWEYIHVCGFVWFGKDIKMLLNTELWNNWNSLL